MRLKVRASKSTYFVGERAEVEIEFINLMEKTLCFPVPAQDCEDSDTGDLLTFTSFVETEERDWFHCHRDGGGIPRDKVLSEIQEHWIKLAPNAVYTTAPYAAYGTLDKSGQWELIAHYHPPEGAFDRDYRDHLQSAAAKAGCTLPTADVFSPTVTVTAISPSEKK